MRFISLLELLDGISSIGDGCKFSEAAQFLYLKLSTRSNEKIVPGFEKTPCPLTGRQVVEPRTKQWNEARALLETLSYDSGIINISEDDFGKTQIYGFDRSEMTAFLSSFGVNINTESVAPELSEKPDSKKAPPEEKPLSAKERNTLLRLVIGMAVSGYGYDPSAVRSPIPKQITGDLDALGLSMDDGTVLKYLKQAAAIHLPASQPKT